MPNFANGTEELKGKSEFVFLHKNIIINSVKLSTQHTQEKKAAHTGANGHIQVLDFQLKYVVLTHSHTMTPFDAPWKQAFRKHCGKRGNCL